MSRHRRSGRSGRVPRWMAAALVAGLAALVGLGAAQTGAAQTRTVDPAGVVVAQNGGIYADSGLDRYVRQVGTRLLMAAGQPVRGWRFAVLDTPVANAFALPDGTILITRGMLALADDEAELAAVLAHEIGHAVSGDGLARVDGQSGDRMTQEVRADQLGFGYLVAAGYDGEAQADILAALAASQALAARIGGRAAVASTDHPGYGARIAEARHQAARFGVGPGQGTRGREAYLAAIDGLTWGDGPAQGFVTGRSFVHPGLGFAFDPPPGYRVENHSDAVVARGPGGAMLVLDSVPASGARPETYLLRGWAPLIARGVPVQGLRRVVLNGLPAAQGSLVLGRTAVDLTVVEQGGAFYRLNARHDARDRVSAVALAETAASFRGLTAADERAAAPLRVRVHRVRPGDNVAVLAATMPLGPGAREWFDVINGLARGGSLQVGDAIKLVGR